MGKILDNVIKFSLYLVVFLLPLFWLPFSAEAFEFNKQYLLFFIVTIAFLAWLAKMVLVDKEIRLKKTPFNIPVLIFLGVAILSAIFSVDKISSLLGFYGRFSDGLISLLSLGGLYFLIANNVSLREKSPSVNSLLRLFLWSTFFVILMSYFSIFGIWTKIQSSTGLGLPQALMQRTFNPASGSMEGLAIFLSVVIVLLVGLLLIRIRENQSRFKDIFYYFLIIISLVLLLVIDFMASWIVLGLTLLFFILVTLWKRMPRRLLLPIGIIVIAIVFLITSPLKDEPGWDLAKNLPREQVLDQGNSWQIAFRAVTDNVKNGFLGSGLGTFSYDFSKFKSAEFNQNNFWFTRFDRPSSHFTEIIATLGFLGLLSYLFLIGFFLIISWLFLTAKLNTQSKDYQITNYQLPLLMGFVALVVGQFVYYQNSTLAFVFWLILGLSVASWQRDSGELKYSFKDFSEMGLVFSVLLAIITLGFFGTYFFGVKFYMADCYYHFSSQIQDGQIPDLNTRIQNLEKAVSLSPWRIEYRIAEARTYLEDALNEMREPVATIAEQDLVKIQNRVAKAISEAKTASQISPNRVVAWEGLGVIYRDIRTVAAGATDWGIKSFERAALLEPANPVIYTELGKLYLVLEDEQKAREYFQKALEEKPDYADAIIQEALVLEREDILEEAIARLENLITREPWNIEAHFQLGRLYYNAGRIDEAIELFGVVALLVPQHSNALYSLGVAYVAQDRIPEAILVFERVLELNPGNQDVIQKLETLKRQAEPEEPEEQEEQEESEEPEEEEEEGQVEPEEPAPSEP